MKGNGHKCTSVVEELLNLNQFSRVVIDFACVIIYIVFLCKGNETRFIDSMR